MSEILTLISKEMHILQQKQEKMKNELDQMMNSIEDYQKLDKEQKKQIDNLLQLNTQLKEELLKTPQLSLSQAQLDHFQLNIQTQLSTLSLNSLIEKQVKQAIEKELHPIVQNLKTLLDQDSQNNKVQLIDSKVEQIGQEVQSLLRVIQSQVS